MPARAWTTLRQREHACHSDGRRRRRVSGREKGLWPRDLPTPVTGRTYQSLYRHLSRFSKGPNKGDRVEQGQTIGYIGQSGLATGPHLHYEFLVGGVRRDPLSVKEPIADPLPKREMRCFNRIASPLLARPDATSRSRLLARAH